MADRPWGPIGVGRSPVEARGAMAATSQPLATQAALEILRAGGSAADGAIAAAAVLCVTEPMSTGLGGDAFVLGYDRATDTLYGVNASGPAPAAADADALAERYGRMPSTGLHSVTVPGAADGWRVLHERYGVLPLRRVLEPAIRYARDGFPVAAMTAAAWQRTASKLQGDPEAAHIFLPGGRAPRRGEVFANPALARTLEAVAEDPRVLYEGEVGRAIAAECERRGGWLAEADLRAYRSAWVAPLRFRFAGFEVCELPPNGQGMFALEILGILEHMGLEALGFSRHGAPDHPLAFEADALHALLEATKVALADRQRYLADPEAGVPVDTLLSSPYLSRRASEIALDRAAEPGPMEALHGDTVYLTVVDEARNAVSFIQSLYEGFGSGVGVRGTGLVLQNRGAGFTLEPGHPNRLAPGRRPRHTIIPAMVLAEGRPYLSFGVMGGDMQAQGHAQVLLHHLVAGLDVQAAGEAARAYYDPARGFVALESGYGAEVRRDLARRGHRVVEAPGVFGGYQAIRIDPETGVLTGGSDPRKDGQASGY
ncbi:MAG: gamma-glutamyltransferase family protein [Firmicutes bacterium]|nr:gamma-glutamyltransferase family protein [Bacillota bacterium]